MDDTVITSLTDFIKGQLPEWYGPNTVLNLSSISTLVYPYSFFLSMPIGQKTLLAKIKRQPDMKTLPDAIASKRLIKPSKDEYAMTKKIWEVFEAKEDSGFTAVKPLAHLEAWNALVMEKVEGKALKALLLHPKIFLRSRKAQKNLQEFVAASARWVRIMHDQVSEMEEIPFPTKLVWQDIEESLSRLKDHKVDVEIYRQVFENAIKEMEKENIPFGIVHDDFHYSNILVDGKNRVCAIDNAGNYKACAYVDLATLITDPQTRMVQILTAGHYISTDFVNTCKKTILENYFGEQSFSKKTIGFFCALATLNKWSEGLTRFSNKTKKKIPAIFLKWIERYFSKLLFEYL